MSHINKKLDFILNRTPITNSSDLGWVVSYHPSLPHLRKADSLIRCTCSCTAEYYWAKLFHVTSVRPTWLDKRENSYFIGSSQPNMKPFYCPFKPSLALMWLAANDQSGRYRPISELISGPNLSVSMDVETGNEIHWGGWRRSVCTGAGDAHNNATQAEINSTHLWTCLQNEFLISVGARTRNVWTTHKCPTGQRGNQTRRAAQHLCFQTDWIYLKVLGISS